MEPCFLASRRSCMWSLRLLFLVSIVLRKVLNLTLLSSSSIFSVLDTPSMLIPAGPLA